MIKFKDTSGGRVPHIVCDVCGEIIETADQGIALHDERERTYKFVHKNMEGRSCDSGHEPWDGIGVLMFRLCHNLKIDMSREKRFAESLGGYCTREELLDTDGKEDAP